MTELIGLPLAVARERLTRQGYAVASEEVRSRKGSGGSEERVIRVCVRPDGTVLLSTALFVALEKALNPA